MGIEEKVSRLMEVLVVLTATVLSQAQDLMEVFAWACQPIASPWPSFETLSAKTLLYMHSNGAICSNH